MTRPILHFLPVQSLTDRFTRFSVLLLLVAPVFAGETLRINDDRHVLQIEDNGFRFHFAIVNDGGPLRWASSFVIFPKNQLAGVALGSDEKSVTVGSKEYSMEVSKSGPITFHYLNG